MCGFCCTRFRGPQCHWSHFLPTYAPMDRTPTVYWFGRLTGFGVYTSEGGTGRERERERERRAQIMKKSRSHVTILAARRATCSKLHTGDTHMLGVTVNCCPGFCASRYVRVFVHAHAHRRSLCVANGRWRFHYRSKNSRLSP